MIQPTGLNGEQYRFLKIQSYNPCVNCPFVTDPDSCFSHVSSFALISYPPSLCCWQELIQKVLFHWKMPSFDIWRGSDLLTCRLFSWDHSAHPARQFCRRRCRMLRTHNIQISWPPGKFRAQQSTALSPWLCTELTSSVIFESHRTGSMKPSGDPRWYLAQHCPAWCGSTSVSRSALGALELQPTT